MGNSEEIRKASRAIFLVASENVAGDISDKLIEGADAIDKLAALCTLVERWRSKNMRAKNNYLVAASFCQCANELEAELNRKG